MADPQTEADQWNDGHPIGTPVVYWPGVRAGEGRQSTTRSEAWVLPSGAVVVKVEGYAGGISIDYVWDLDTCACGEPIEPVPTEGTRGYWQHADRRYHDHDAEPAPRDLEVPMRADADRIVREIVELYVENREVHGHDHDQALAEVLQAVQDARLSLDEDGRG